MGDPLSMGIAGHLFGKKKGGSSGKGDAKQAVLAERESAAKAAEKSAATRNAELATPSLMSPLKNQSRQNSINAISKMDKYA